MGLGGESRSFGAPHTTSGAPRTFAPPSKCGLEGQQLRPLPLLAGPRADRTQGGKIEGGYL